MVLLASSYDQSRFLNAADFEQEKKFRIKEVTEEEVGEKKEQKLVVWFTNDKHGLVLNKTNNRTLRGAYGDAVDGWKEKIIVVFPTMVDMRGKMVPALRVRIPPPKQATTAPTAPAPKPSGNGAASIPASALDTFGRPRPTAADPELDDEPKKSLRDDLEDEIPF
jgi:hypothetical protein